MGHLLLNRLNQVLTRGSICLPEDLLSGGVMDDPTVLLVAPVSVQMGDGHWPNHLALVTSPFSLKQEAIPSRYLITQSSTFQALDLLLTDDGCRGQEYCRKFRIVRKPGRWLSRSEILKISNSLTYVKRTVATWAAISVVRNARENTARVGISIHQFGLRQRVLAK